MLVEQRAGTWAVGSLLAQDLILLRRQPRAPFCIGLFDFEFLSGVCRRSPQPAEGRKAKKTGNGREQNTAVDHDGLRARRICWFTFKYAARQPKVHGLGRKFLTFLRGIVPRTRRRALGAALPPPTQAP